MLGSLILYLKGMRITMFQLSGFYRRRVPLKASGSSFKRSVWFFLGVSLGCSISGPGLGRESFSRFLGA